MNTNPVSREFSVVAKITGNVETVNADPEKSLRNLLRLANIFTNKNCKQSEATKKAALSALEHSATAVQKNILINFPENFEANWLTARLMHRMGRYQDALTFLNAAEKLNNSVRGIPFRRAEILSDLHQELPNKGYSKQAFWIAASATTKHPSLRNITLVLSLGAQTLGFRR